MARGKWKVVEVAPAEGAAPAAPEPELDVDEVARKTAEALKELEELRLANLKRSATKDLEGHNKHGKGIAEYESALSRKRLNLQAEIQKAKRELEMVKEGKKSFLTIVPSGIERDKPRRINVLVSIDELDRLVRALAIADRIISVGRNVRTGSFDHTDADAGITGKLSTYLVECLMAAGDYPPTRVPDWYATDDPVPADFDFKAYANG